MHQNHSIFLQQLYYGKISFILLLPVVQVALKAMKIEDTGKIAATFERVLTHAG